MRGRITVLLVADNASACRAVRASLSDEKIFDVIGPHPPLEALRFCIRFVPPIVVVHAGLTDMRAAEFCQVLRGRAKDRPFSALLFGAVRQRALVNPHDVASADGFIARDELPFLSARLKTLAMRNALSDEPSPRQYRGRHLKARFDRVEILVDSVRIDLTRRELGLLEFLVTHHDQVLSREDILAHVWRNENDGRSRTVDAHVHRLRMKLGTAGNQIETVSGIGYRFRED